MSDEETFEDAVDNLANTLDKNTVLSNDNDEKDDEHLSYSSESNSNHRDYDVEADDCSCPATNADDAQQKPDVIDESVLRQQEACMTDEEKQCRRNESQRLKELGNEQYNEGHYEAAIDFYTDALAVCLLCHQVDRAILYANRAAAKVKLDQKESAISDCTKALEYNPDHMKALLRRAELYEKTDKLDEALEDYTKAVERDPSLHFARAACMRLPDQIKERNEKMKEEMLGKLKDLGNMILRPFGLSTDNFKLQQDPATGSYSVSFQQQQQSQSSR